MANDEITLAKRIPTRYTGGMTLSEWKAGQPGLTTEALAALCGVTRVAMHRLLFSHNPPSHRTTVAILRVTGGAVTASDMFDSYMAAHRTDLRPAIGAAS